MNARSFSQIYRSEFETYCYTHKLGKDTCYFLWFVHRAHYKDGTLIGDVRTWAEQCGISRNTLPAVLRRLEERGVLEYKPSHAQDGSLVRIADYDKLRPQGRTKSVRPTEADEDGLLGSRTGVARVSHGSRTVVARNPCNSEALTRSDVPIRNKKISNKGKRKRLSVQSASEDEHLAEAGLDGYEDDGNVISLATAARRVATSVAQNCSHCRRSPSEACQLADPQDCPQQAARAATAVNGDGLTGQPQGPS